MPHRWWIFLALVAWVATAVGAQAPTRDQPGAPAPSDSLQILDLQRSRGVPFVLPPGDDAWLRPFRVTPSPQALRSLADEFAAIDALFAEPERPDESEAATPQETATAPVSDVPMRPKNLVWVRAPEQLIMKRKIHDAVQLQALIGPDGRVADIRVLRGIPRCSECVESAVLAAMQYVYDTPDASMLPFGVWTLPFEIGFSYRH